MFSKFYHRFKSDSTTSFFLLIFLMSLFSIFLSVYTNYKLEKEIKGLTNIPNNGVKTLAIGDLIRNIKQDSPRIGNRGAKVTMVEFEDFQCPFCRKFEEDIFPSIKKEYIDTGRVLFIHEDLAFLGPESNIAAEAAHCANEQGKFWEYRAYLYHNQARENSSSLTDNKLKAIAGTLGLNTDGFNACYDSHKYKSIVTSQTEFAGSYGITATPTFVINGQIIKGAQPLTNFQSIINAALNN